MHTQGSVNFDPVTRQLYCKGEWNLRYITSLQKQLKKIILPSTGSIIVDGAGITLLDSAGAFLLRQYLKKINERGLKVRLQQFSEPYQKLLSLVESEFITQKPPKTKEPSTLALIGKYALNQVSGFINFLSFIGKLAIEYLSILGHPSRWRIGAITNILDHAGYQALPIIALLSFLIGVVITYQMAQQLKSYGANLFIVDFIGIAVLREFGPLLTSIMMAGRTGSSFTAQIGSMKINQEIDALNTMGVTSEEILLLPRLTGLFISLPLLTLWSDIFGVLGGMMMANHLLNITTHDFLARFQHEIPVRTLLVGLGKAPVFALLIASIGCYQGMLVQGSAANLGKKTTRSVVLSIFFIIVADAVFSVIYSKFKI